MATLKEIKEDIEALKDAFVGGVKHYIKLPLWLKITAGVVVLLFIIQLWSVFKKREPVNQDYLKRMNALDSTVKYQQKTIDIYQSGQAMRDSIIIRELTRISGSKQTQTRIIKEYEQIPIDVKSYDREQLRRQITDY